mgnify:CR=1 FL=1
MMKRIAILFLMFGLLATELSAQTKARLKVGDPAPALVPFKHIKGKPFNGFEKGKVYVIDFGATWCVPCKALIPHMTELAKKHKDVDVLGMFIWEVTNKKDKNDLSYIKRVENYVADMGYQMQYNVAVDDVAETIANNWVRAAGFSGVPVVFVIDKQGKIACMGYESETGELDNVVEKVKNGTYDFATDTTKKKIKIPYDITKPYLIGGNGGNDSSYNYRSVLAPYKVDTEFRGHFGYISGYRYAEKFKDSLPETYALLRSYQGRVQETNASLSHLYYMAYADTLRNSPSFRRLDTGEFPDTVAIPEWRTSYGRFWPEPILEVSDEAPFKFSEKNFKNLYNYSLIVPLEKASAAFLQKAMQKDLDIYFGYDVKVDDRMMPCWKLQFIENGKINFKLVEQGKTKNEQTNGGWLWKNAIPKDLVAAMALSFSYQTNQNNLSEKAPFIHDTGITSHIEFFRSDEHLNKGFVEKNWDVVMDFYKGLGLQWVKGEKMMKVVVSRDGKR